MNPDQSPASPVPEARIRTRGFEHWWDGLGFCPHLQLHSTMLGWNAALASRKELDESGEALRVSVINFLSVEKLGRDTTYAIEMLHQAERAYRAAQEKTK